MNSEEYLEKYYIVIPGELKAVQVNDNIIQIIDGHYSTGAIFNIKVINSTNYLRYGLDYIGIIDGVVRVCSKLDQFDSLVTFGQWGGDTSLTKLKVMEGYLDSEMKVGSLENALLIQWMWCGLVNDEDIKDLSNTQGSIISEINYASVDGVNLLDESKFFYMLNAGYLWDHAFCSGSGDNSLGYYTLGTDNLKFIFKMIDDNIFIYSPEFGYLGFGIDDRGEDTAVFSKSIPTSPITLIKTDKKSTYLLGQNNSYLKIKRVTSLSFTVITAELSEASEYQFVLINKDLKDWY